MRQTHSTAMVRAGLVGPAAGALWSVAFAGAAIALAVGGFQSFDPWIGLLSALLPAFVIILVLTWTAGLTWHAAACRLNWRGLLPYLAAGATVGAIVGLLLIGWIFSRADAAFQLGFATWAISCGAIVASAGWLVRRPDRDQRLASASNGTSA